MKHIAKQYEMPIMDLPKTFAPEPLFNHVTWFQSQNGQYEIATALRRLAKDCAANDAQTEPVI